MSQLAKSPILILKTFTAPAGECFWEVLDCGNVAFDPRPDWVLVATPPGASKRRQEIRWIHPDDLLFVWARWFDFLHSTSQTQ